MTLPEDEVQRIARVLATQAAEADDSVKFVRNVINAAGLPADWRLEVIGWSFADLKISTRNLLRWADHRGVNPADPRYTTSGSFVAALLPLVGPDLGAPLVAAALRYRLVRGAGDRAAFAARYQVPLVHPAAETDTFALPAPPVDETDDDVTLQGLAPEQPDLLDVAMLAEAIRRAGSVCRVETADERAYGTGLLIAPDLVLTCRHVVEQAGTTDLRMRFRCTTGNSGTAIPVAADDPVARSSPVPELDFTVLRLSGIPNPDDGIGPAELGGGTPPRGSAVSILQHPRGRELKLAVSGNGVVRAYPARSAIRYVSTTAGGSSGSPCFDENWQVFAIHRAERATYFGAVREGVLAAAIRQQIADLL